MSILDRNAFPRNLRDMLLSVFLMSSQKGSMAEGNLKKAEESVFVPGAFNCAIERQCFFFFFSPIGQKV